jgi:hypothetical protein
LRFSIARIRPKNLSKKNFKNRQISSIHGWVQVCRQKDKKGCGKNVGVEDYRHFWLHHKIEGKKKKQWQIANFLSHALVFS